MVLKKLVTLVLLVVMTTLEMNGKQILSSEKVWYCTQTKSYWKLIFWDINLKFGTQIV